MTDEIHEGGEIIQLVRARPSAAPASESEPIELTDWNPWEHTGGPLFPLETLPETLRAWAKERAQTTGADVSAYAMAALMSLSAAIDHRVALKPKKHDPGYFIHPVLWTMLVADPSARKSAPIEDIASMMREMDRRAIKARENEIEKARAAGASDKQIEEKVPRARRHVLSDATSEMLCEILSHQDSGITLFRDELSGWIGGIEKYGGGGRATGQDRSIWIASHASGHYTQDRIKASRSVSNLSCSIFGAIQPQRLAELGKLDSDGLLQRFAPIMMVRADHDRDEEVDPQIRKRFKTMLADVDALSPWPFLTFDDEARQAWMVFSHQMTDLSSIKDPSPAFGAFLGKQARTCGVIAMLLHIADIATGGQYSRGDPIPLATVTNAIAIMERFMLPHAQIFYSSISSKGTNDTEAIASALLKLAGRHITPSSLHHKCNAIRNMDGLAEIQRALIPFVYNGWLMPDSWLPDNTGWRVHSGLVGKFVEEQRRMIETHRKLVELIAKSKGSKPKLPAS